MSCCVRVQTRSLKLNLNLNSDGNLSFNLQQELLSQEAFEEQERAFLPRRSACSIGTKQLPVLKYFNAQNTLSKFSALLKMAIRQCGKLDIDYKLHHESLFMSIFDIDCFVKWNLKSQSWSKDCSVQNLSQYFRSIPDASSIALFAIELLIQYCTYGMPTNESTVRWYSTVRSYRTSSHGALYLLYLQFGVDGYRDRILRILLSIAMIDLQFDHAFGWTLPC